MNSRMRALLIALCLMLSVASASAQSLFPQIPQKFTEDAPSYGVLMDVAPLRETTLDDGSLQQVYAGVTQEDFNAFGVYLAEKEYTLPNYGYVGDHIMWADVVKGTMTFQVVYDWSDLSLTVTYPKGVTVEKKDLSTVFEGYTRIDWDEQVQYGKMARITPKSFTYNTVNWGNYCLLNMECYNISRDSVATRAVIGGSDGVQVTLHFINEIDHYTYEVKSCGVRVTSFGDNVLRDQNIPSLTAKNFSARFALPGNVFNSDEGTLALTFTYGTQSYVLYIREAAE